MVQPNQEQRLGLEELRLGVVSLLETLDTFASTDTTELLNVPLGLLRKSATQRHGVTRWIRLEDGTLKVEVVELHPRLFEEPWHDYGAFVLFHEFLHVLGFRAHDSTFRALEAQWPNHTAAGMGKAFTHAMRLGRARWLWYCSSCRESYPRQRKSNGKFQCRKCRKRLEDRPMQDSQ